MQTKNYRIVSAQGFDDIAPLFYNTALFGGNSGKLNFIPTREEAQISSSVRSGGVNTSPRGDSTIVTVTLEYKAPYTIDVRHSGRSIGSLTLIKSLSLDRTIHMRGDCLDMDDTYSEFGPETEKNFLRALKEREDIQSPFRKVTQWSLDLQVQANCSPQEHSILLQFLDGYVRRLTPKT